MCTISDHSVWKWYLLITDGTTLPTIRQHMAKICPFLESKADIFSSYLPVSDINLAIEIAFGTASSDRTGVCFLSASSDEGLFGTISFCFCCIQADIQNWFDVNAKTTCCHNNFQKHLKNSCWLTEEKCYMCTLGNSALFVCPEHIHKPHIGIVNYLQKEWYENYLSIYQHYNFWHSKCAMLLTVTVQNMEEGW